MASRKTKAFQNLLQENFQELMGMDISKELAWQIFKASIVTAVQFLISLVDKDRLEDVKLPLSGVGTFRIDFRRPRKSPGKESELAKKVEWIPYLRFRASTRFRRLLLKLFCGYDEPIPVSRSVQERQKKSAAKKAAKRRARPERS